VNALIFEPYVLERFGNITDKGVVMIAEGCSHIQCLDLYECLNVTEKSARLFSKVAVIKMKKKS
jgi:hypothetical protein